MSRNVSLGRYLLVVALAAAASARERPSGHGAAIGLEYSVQHDVLQPGADVALLLCLTNGNPHSSRDIAPGDSFSFTFPEGVVRGCGDLSVFSPSGSLSVGAFECDVTSNVVSLTHGGRRPTRWPLGDAACVLVAYTAGAGPSTISASMDVGNQGAFLAPSPAVLLLSVARGLGTPGPVGPAGPPGPPGVAGASGIGNRMFATSTGMVQARQHEPPVPLPGLDVTIDVAAGSSIEVTADTLAMPCEPPFPAYDVKEYDTGILLEVDGLVVASRSVSLVEFTASVGPYFGDPVLIHWQSDPLPAGSHRVQVLVNAPHPNPWFPMSDDYTLCVGSALNDEYQARLSVKELPARP